MKYTPFHKIAFVSVTLVIVTITTFVTIKNPNASFHTFDDIPSFLPSFSPTLAPPPLTPSSSPIFQDCLNQICKGIPPFTIAFNECLRQCFAGKKSSTGSMTASTSSIPSPLIFSLPSFSSLSQSSSTVIIPDDQTFCIDVNGRRVTDRTLCASPTIQGTVLFPSRITPTKPIDDLIAEFLGVTNVPPHQIQPPPLAQEHDPLNVLTALYTIFQRLPEFLQITTGSPLITGSAVDQAYQGYRDARLELLNARTQCAEFFRTSGKTPCTVALRSSVYALGKIRISIEPILIQDSITSAKIADLFKNLTAEWNHSNGPESKREPSLEIHSDQPFLE